MAVIPGLPSGSNLAKAMTGLSTEDQYQLTEQQRQITSSGQRAERRYKTGTTSATNDRNLAIKRAVMNMNQNRILGQSQAADSGLGWSPGVSGVANAAAAQGYALQQSQVQQDFAAAQAALESMIQDARLTQAEQEAAIVRDAARRQQGAKQIRSYGA